MKNHMYLIKKSTLAILGLAFSLGAYANGNRLAFTAELTSGNEVPPVNSDGYGVAMFSFNDQMDSLFVDVQASNLSSDFAGAHIHEGTSTENGSVVVNLSDMFSSNKCKGVITGSDLAALDKSTLVKGGYYLNIHTTDNPGGELRGQIDLEQDWVFTSWLSGANEVPALNVDGYGLLTARLSRDMSKLWINASFSALTGPVTGAHFHEAAAGTNGSVVLNLSDSVDGNMLSAVVDPSTFLMSLLNDDIYLNVHTSANPGGEIRGQIIVNGNIGFTSMLNGMNEVPSVNTTAWGHASIQLVPSLDTLWYHVTAYGLSGSITGAHLHMGMAGENGDVVLNMTGDIQDSMIVGYTTDFQPEWIAAMMMQNIYLNIHTEENPGGEIRGQLWPSLRNSYVLDLSGDQEVPMVSTSARGLGFVSISSEGSNAYTAVVLDGLSGSITGAHFHNAALGENGDVIVNITDQFMMTGSWDYAAGYQMMNDGWDMGYAELFMNKAVYLNIHTAENPGGEIRGQAMDQMLKGEVLSATNLSPLQTVEVFPNPARNDQSITVALHASEKNGLNTIELLDMQGRVVLSNKVDPSTQNYQTLSIQGVKSGTYTIKVSFDKQIATSILIVE